MKKILLIMAVLLLGGCNNTPVEQTDITGRHLIEVGWEASCVDYEIHDEKGNKIEVPFEVDGALKCATGALDISKDENYLIYEREGLLKNYNFENGSVNELIKLDDGIEGIGCEWSSTEEKLACALINQQKYEGGTKFIVINVDEGVFVSSEEYAITYETMADFVCGASCYPGSFWFETENLIKYEGHNIVVPGEIFEINL